MLSGRIVSVVVSVRVEVVVSSSGAVIFDLSLQETTTTDMRNKNAIKIFFIIVFLVRKTTIDLPFIYKDLEGSNSMRSSPQDFHNSTRGILSEHGLSGFS